MKFFKRDTINAWLPKSIFALRPLWTKFIQQLFWENFHFFVFHALIMCFVTLQKLLKQSKSSKISKTATCFWQQILKLPVFCFYRKKWPLKDVSVLKESLSIKFCCIHSHRQEEFSGSSMIELSNFFPHEQKHLK